MTIKTLSPEFLYKDERGNLTQIVSGGYSQINILESNPGVTRGRHYHKLCCEAFYVIEGAITLKVEKDGKSAESTFHSGGFFEIPPGVMHEMYFPQRCIMVALYDRPVETEFGKDIYEQRIMR